MCGKGGCGKGTSLDEMNKKRGCGEGTSLYEVNKKRGSGCRSKVTPFFCSLHTNSGYLAKTCSAQGRVYENCWDYCGI